jgi:outer membrane receptor protein involved in Fe transport
MTAKRLITGILSVLVVAAMIAPSLMAQSLVSGDLTGTVTDPSGAVVAGATVNLKNEATGQTHTTTTNSNGNYRFSLLTPGTYTVSVNATGFSKSQTTAMVNVGQASIADVKMSVGAASQTVEVTSVAPLIQTEGGDLSTNFDQNLIANAPNGGGDLTYIAQTAPGINMNTGLGYGNFNTAGLPATSNVFTTNGENQMDPYLNLNNSGATNLMLGKNAVQEATVVTNAYGGQYGQQAGAQVSYVTKSGTNAFHGNAQYWWTGSSLDANSWFNGLSSPAQPTPFNNNNAWAASVGGPIKKDKLFFFADWEGIRYIVPTTQLVFVPTTAFANSVLNNIAATDPAELGLYQKAFALYEQAPGYNNGTPNAGSCGDLSPALFSGACSQSYTASPALPAKEWLVTGRVDYNLSDKDHLFWSVSFDHGTQATFPDPINSNFSAASYQPQYNGQGQWTHTFGSNATNQFVYAGSYYRAIFDQINAAATFPYELALGGIGFNNLNTLGYAFPQGRNATQYQFVDDFSVTKGAHNLKFGGNFRRYDITDYATSSGTNPLAIFGSTTNFYNGISDVFTANYPSRLSEPVALWGLGVYAQDEWRVTKSLKLTFGLRAEHDSNPVCQTDCAAQLTTPFSAASTDITTPYNQLVDAGRHQIFKSVDSINWAPRFGFAWSPGGSDKTVVRGGIGLFYDAFPAFLGDDFILNFPNYVPVTQFGVPWADQTTPASPYLIGQNSAAQIRSGFTSGASLASLTAANPLFSAPNFGSMPNQFHIPRYQEWSLQIEQQLDSRSSLSIAYIGNHGLNEPITNFPNAFGGFGGLPAAAPNSNFAGVTEVYSGAVSNDNQLTTSYQRRLTYGFTIQASYTWAHALDEISNGGVLGYSATSATYALNPYNIKSNYGNADYDIRSSFNAQYVWNTPWKFGSKWANFAFGGWTLSQNFFARSGLPLTVLDATSPVGNYNYNSANTFLPAGVVGQGQGTCTQFYTGCLSAAGFSSASNYATFPPQVRNSYRGPGFFDSDLSLNKNFKLTERLAFGVGATAYNIFNHPNFAEPANLLGSSVFGQVTTQTAPPTGPFGSFISGLPANRILQLQGKIVF